MTIMFRRTYFAKCSEGSASIPIATIEAMGHAIVIKDISFFVVHADGVAVAPSGGFQWLVSVGGREIRDFSSERIWTSEPIVAVARMTATQNDVKFVGMQISGILVEDGIAVDSAVLGREES